MSGYNLETQQFHKCSLADFVDLINQKQTFIVYFGYESCPWCNDLLPILNEVSIEKEKELYYIDFLADENNSDIDSLETILDLASEYLNENEDGNIEIFFPMVFYVQKGQIIDVHIGTLSNHDASKDELTQKQAARLKYNLEKEFDQLMKE